MPGEKRNRVTLSLYFIEEDRNWVPVTSGIPRTLKEGSTGDGIAVIPSKHARNRSGRVQTVHRRT